MSMERGVRWMVSLDCLGVCEPVQLLVWRLIPKDGNDR